MIGNKEMNLKFCPKCGGEIEFSEAPKFSAERGAKIQADCHTCDVHAVGSNNNTASARLVMFLAHESTKKKGMTLS